MSFTTFAAGCFTGPDFCLITASGANVPAQEAAILSKPPGPSPMALVNGTERTLDLPQAEAPTGTHAHSRFFHIITALLAFPLQASSASTAASPPLLPPPRPAEA